MSYRSDDQARCGRCSNALPAHDGLFSPSGELLCRACAASLDAAAADARIREAAIPAWRPERPNSKRGYWSFAPPVFLIFTYLLQLAERPSCSELACLGIGLNVLAGTIVSIPCGIVAVMTVPGAARRRVALLAGAICLFFVCAGLVL